MGETLGFPGVGWVAVHCPGAGSVVKTNDFPVEQLENSAWAIELPEGLIRSIVSPALFNKLPVQLKVAYPPVGMDPEMVLLFPDSSCTLNPLMLTSCALVLYSSIHSDPEAGQDIISDSCKRS